MPVFGALSIGLTYALGGLVSYVDTLAHSRVPASGTPLRHRIEDGLWVPNDSGHIVDLTQAEYADAIDIGIIRLALIEDI